MKKRHVAGILLMLCATAIMVQGSNDKVRSKLLFNFDWKFRAGEIKDGYKYDLNDVEWRKLDLPHDFQFDQPWDETAGGPRGFKAMGEGWYRKTFQADPQWKGKRVLLDFEGIMLVGDVWLNGVKIGGTDYGYVGFDSDITKQLKFDAPNVVAVHASTGKKGGSRWYTGGGLFRDVHVIVKDSTAIARHGIFVTTPVVSEQSAQVHVQVEVEGLRNKKSPVEIHVKIISPDGNVVGETRINAPKRSNKMTEEVALPLVQLTNPLLWSCEKPQLYTAEVSLSTNDKVFDRLTERFGVRTVEFSKEFGFKLNGKKVFLKGIANHHDLGAVGVAAYETAIARQMDKLKEFGYNHIRTSHNPYSESFLHLADEKGILIVDELYDKWSNKDYWAGRVAWTELWPKNLTEWIKRDRNHPSVIMWSFGNELQMREDLAGYPTGDWGVTTYKMMDVLAKRYDPTRKTTVAMFPARAGGVGKNDPNFNIDIVPPELATVTEVSSFNYRWFNYQDYLKHAPHMIMYQSEATTNELVAPFYGMDQEKMVGLAYWGAIEYWGESSGWPKKGWHYSYFNHALEAFPQAYLIKSIFTDEPLVHIGVAESNTDTLTWNDVVVGKLPLTSHWNRESGKKYNLFTYTNADEVELYLNGKSLGIQKNNTGIDTRNMIYWQNVPYQAGSLLAIARKGGKEIARHQLETTGQAVGLKMIVENTDWKANGMDLQYVKVYAVDNKGRVVPTATGDVTFDVSGQAKLIAVDNGDHSSEELFAGNKRRLHQGFALAILRSNQTLGDVNIKASVKGLKKAEKKMVTK